MTKEVVLVEVVNYLSLSPNSGNMKSTKWFDRKFDFSAQQNNFPSIIERLRGTPARLEERCRAIPESWLKTNSDNSWSIKENIGHLTDLEPLWQGRLDDIKSGKEDLRPTDLANRKTDEAGHNAKSLNQLLRDFRKARAETIAMIEGLDEDMIFRSALHPRLKTPMRTMDHFLFVAEHDDHHLARITELMRIFERGGL
ncbi:MAG TPA: DinB family protein [Mucilaginibacter sp.]|nr:DinB family protein [Mucilaginibacter sp.]